ncbi:TPA: PD-(D/E)XK nuclease-like domain-containing protein [Stenotrophomonas maltophilia]
MEPGIYRNLENDAYHGGPGDSKSSLDLLRKAPAKLRAVKTGLHSRTPTKSQMTGTSIHAMVLEPELVARTYALPFVAPDGTLATMDQMKAALTAAGVEFKASTNKAGLEALVREHLPDASLLTDLRATYDAANAGKVVIEATEWARLENMLAAVRAHPAAMKLLRGAGEAELSCYWRQPVVDPATGQQLRNQDGSPAELLLRCRPDYWRHDGIIVDLKSTAPGGASPEEFARSVHKWRYFVQHPLYLRGAAAALAAAGPEFAAYQRPREFVFVVVETDACVVDGVAMGVATYVLDSDSVQFGELQAAEDVAALWKCYASGSWPGYSARIEPLSLPAYAFPRVAA